MLINQDLAARLQTGIPPTQLPTHVTGGLPIQQYLQGLLERMPHPLPDDVFSFVSHERGPEPSEEVSRSTLRSDSQLDTMPGSEYRRESFLNSFMLWAERHRRVKVKISGLDRSCYVWQSILNDSTTSSLEPSSTESAIPLHELNISPPIPEAGAVPVPPVEEVQRPPPDPVHGAIMFRR